MWLIAFRNECTAAQLSPLWRAGRRESWSSSPFLRQASVQASANMSQASFWQRRGGDAAGVCGQLSTDVITNTQRTIGRSLSLGTLWEQSEAAAAGRPMPVIHSRVAFNFFCLVVVGNTRRGREGRPLPLSELENSFHQEVPVCWGGHLPFISFSPKRI